MNRKLPIRFVLFAAVLSPAACFAATPVPMAAEMIYSENFSDIVNWGDGFASGSGAEHFAPVPINVPGFIPDGVKITASTETFITLSNGSGVHKGAENIILHTAGSTENSTSAAFDLFLDFTAVNAGTISFDWAILNNDFVNGNNRTGSLRTYCSVDGVNFVEIDGASVRNFVNGSGATGQVANVDLPFAMDQNPNARLRFYYHNGQGGSIGRRPKISIDNLIITAEALPSSWSLPASASFDDAGHAAVDADNGPFATSATINFTGDVTLENPTVVPPFALAGSVAGSYSNGDSATLNFTYAPSSNSGEIDTQGVTIVAASGLPASRQITLSGQTVKEVSLAAFKSDAETSAAGTTVYKFEGLVSSNSVSPANNWLTLQDSAIGSAATRGVLVHDPAGIGKGASALPGLQSGVIVYGTYANSRGQIQLAPDRPYLSDGTPVAIAPYTINSGGLSDNVEGVLLRIDNTIIPAGPYSVGDDIPANDGNPFTIRIPGDFGNGEPFVSGGGPRQVQGIGGQFNTTESHPLTGGDGFLLYTSDFSSLPVSVSKFVVE